MFEEEGSRKLSFHKNGKESNKMYDLELDCLYRLLLHFLQSESSQMQ